MLQPSSSAMVLGMLSAKEPAAALQGGSVAPLQGRDPAAEIAEFEARMSAQMLAVKVGFWQSEKRTSAAFQACCHLPVKRLRDLCRRRQCSVCIHSNALQLRITAAS